MAETTSRRVLILVGSDSDLPAMRPAEEILAEFGVECEVRVLSAHRSPDAAAQAAASARERGYRVIVCAAVLAAHLAGAVAARTTLPVIGVPLEHGALRGLDALLYTVQMPPGVPVATVGIGAARNAGILALEILGVADPGIAEALEMYKKRLAEDVLEKDKKLRESKDR